ncbi:MAG: carotenoid biosynthesis protein [Armatimonadota bacterium]|nr:carotenoid biosynthesis protein [bacterium]MDW8322371.1 carotenoid biosynthesis protein [Armatimonadota bacterium]
MLLRKLGTLFLLLHAVVAASSLIGTWALYNLSEVPDWDYTALTFWMGIANVLTGVLSALLFMAAREGWKAAAILLTLCIVLAGGMELLGTTTGVPFGRYSYTDLFGPKFLGHVPYLIPPSWMMMLYPAMMLTELLLPRKRFWTLCGQRSDTSPSAIWELLLRAAAAGLILTVWDFAMDPAMTTGFAYWQWHTEGGGFYGMPYINWLGWWFTGALVATVFWAVCGSWKGEWEPFAFVLYLVQGAFMAGLAWLYMRPLASLLWLIAVVILTALVWKRLCAQPELPQEVAA